MTFRIKITISVFLVLFFFGIHSLTFAQGKSTAFFYSNNVQIIDLRQAFERLMGDEQEKLDKTAISSMQHEHMEQGRFKNILGTYTMLGAGTITADNSEIFFTSPLQKLSDNRIFSLATKLAQRLDQESVAVFIPAEKQEIGCVKLKISENKQSIEETVRLIKNKLPPSFSQAFSLNISRHIMNYNEATVNSIAWIGNNLDFNVVKNSFPEDKIIFKTGTSYLIYKDGRRIKLR